MRFVRLICNVNEGREGASTASMSYSGWSLLEKGGDFRNVDQKSPFIFPAFFSSSQRFDHSDLDITCKPLENDMAVGGCVKHLMERRADVAGQYEAAGLRWHGH